MASAANIVKPEDVVDAHRFEGRIIVRRFTDQLTGSDELERSTKAAQEEIDEDERTEEQRRLRLLYEDSSGDDTSPQDFDVAAIARVELQKMVDKFVEDAKPSRLQRIGISTKTAKMKAIEQLEALVHKDIKEFKASIDSLENKWKENHGLVYKAFKRLCGTLNDHKCIFAIFPSENEYTSVLCGSLSCLVQAARTHSEIGETLSKSIASISDKVATCSNLIQIIKTNRMRTKLTGMYARMFKFYRDVIEWYLHSKFSRVLLSFNEKLKREFEGTTGDIEDCIKELYREASVGNAAMTAIMYGDISRLKAEVRRQRQNYIPNDTLAGRRMIILMEASYMDSKFVEQPLSFEKSIHLGTETVSRIEDVSSASITRAQARVYESSIEPFIIGEAGPALFGTGHFWLAEDDVLPKIRAWTVEDKASRTLWVSSPLDPAGTTSARAAALAVVAAGWQAETPLISHFCQRPQRDEVRTGMSIEQAGLLGLVYSLIHQLLQFSGEGDELIFSEENLAALTGAKESWSASLMILKALLDHTPVLMYCVIDGLNDLEWKAGGEWCRQLLNALFARQKRMGTVFNVLLTTAGQSGVLPSYVNLKDRHIATKGARQIAKVGRRIDLQLAEQTR